MGEGEDLIPEKLRRGNVVCDVWLLIALLLYLECKTKIVGLDGMRCASANALSGGRKLGFASSPNI
jgi:hypothetical protein